MIAKEGYDSWWKNMTEFKKKVLMCKKYLPQIQAAAATYGKFMNYFKGEHVCKNRNASNWRDKPYDFYVLYKSFSKIGILNEIEDRDSTVKIEKIMTHDQKVQKLFNDCMADPNVTGTEQEKKDQCTDNSWYDWFVGIYNKVKEYLKSVVKYIETKIIQIKVLVTSFVRQIEFGSIRLWELGKTGMQDIYVDGRGKEHI
jgi:hypothetical protein